MLFSDELKNLPKIRLFGFQTNTVLQNYQIDTRKITQDSVFVALQGSQNDGHNFIETAFSQGAFACVVSENWFSQNKQNFPDKNFIVGKSSLLALQTIASFYRTKLKTQIFALTGSNGKTTTKELLAAVLGEKFRVSKTQGNLNNHIGLPLSILAINENTEIAVLELGANHVGEIAELCEIAKPNFALITNIGRSHIGEFGSEENIFKAKTEIFEAVRKNGKGFVNVNDLRLLALAPINSTTYAFDRKANYTAKILSSIGEKITFSVNKSKPISLKLSGFHNAVNGLSAFAVGKDFGIETEKIIFALENFEGTSGRFNTQKIGKINFIDDSYNANPESMFAALETLAKFQGGKKFAVLGGMLELGAFAKKLHAEVGKKAKESGIDFVLTFGENANFIAENCNGKHFETKQELINELDKNLTEGDFVLLKGSRGMKMEEILKNYEQKNEN